MRLVSVLCTFLLAMLIGADRLHAAQSTADVPVTGKLIEKSRQKVLGEAQAGIGGAEEYVLGQGDILSVQVYGEGEMSAAAAAPEPRNSKAEDDLRPGTGAQVRLDGRISLKHIGDIDAVGFTLTQLADHLKDLYATVFDNPIITVVLVQSNSKRYTVMGKAAHPGIFYLDYPINIVQAIARSGGLTEWAKSEITLVRKDSKKDLKLFSGNKLTFDYDDFLEGRNLAKNVLLQPDDILIVH